MFYQRGGMSVSVAPRRPNVLLILNDDMGYSDLGCYGGEMRTPALDALAADGLRFSQFYNTARCSPSRASLLTGLHPHQTGVGILTDDNSPEGYAGQLNGRCVTLAEVLKSAGYRTGLSGKWHLSNDAVQPNPAWPTRRGFDWFYGTVQGAGSFYAPGTLTRGETNIEAESKGRPDFNYTAAIADEAVGFIDRHLDATRDEPDAPFFLYTAFTAPHWPLHAPSEDIAACRGRFDAGWDRLREARIERMVALGLIDPAWRLSARDPAVPAWADAPDHAWQLRRMEVYAAQLEAMDRGIGRIVDCLRRRGELEDTLILFLSDNGGCAEELSADWAPHLIAEKHGPRDTRDGRQVRYGNDPAVMPGPEDTYQSYGVPWANVSNTPFRYYKHWVHEGGIATPFIAHWPAGFAGQGALRHEPAQLTDVMATVLDVTGALYPATRDGETVLPAEGRSLRPIFASAEAKRGAPLYFEHEGNAAMRDGRWKLVRNFTGARSGAPGFDPPALRGVWELYDMEADRTEQHDLAAEQPERVAAMADFYGKWAARCGVLDRESILRFARR